jgi:predicted ATPase/class 3 adenylate cyclase
MASAEGELPSGTVTFLFTDLESSSRLWEEHPEGMKAALARHDSILREAVEAHGGHVVKTRGDGLHAAFATAQDAVMAAVDGQGRLGAEVWPVTGPLRVRIGVHSGAAESREGDYFGPVLNRAARIMSLAHGGQIVVSHATEELVGDGLASGVELLDLGEHRLRDLDRPERVFQVTAPGLTCEFPPLRSRDHFPGALPEVLTSFVGRERELEAVLEALRQSRIVTVIGVGGVGKTRLALQAATEALPAYQAGAWFCELAAVTDGRAVPEAVAASLEVRPEPGVPLIANLLAALRHKQLLLVLDNCEHLVDAAGALAEAITHACPHVAVLVTSREALGIDGELLRPLGPLPVPEDGSSLGELADAASVPLFADRARAVRPEFELDASRLPVVAEICRRLDGVPLAIELAAARVAALGVADIARRLDQRFRLLTGGRRTALERHQTLRAAVDWSYDLLDQTQARAFNRLAVFAGGLTLEAAEAVLSGDGIESDDVVDVVSDLVARSMVVADESEPTTRYRLDETMRQYAREHLDATGESDTVRRRHGDYYVGLAEMAAEGVKGRDEQRWVRTIDVEFPNFRAALDWAIGIGDADAALRLTVPLGGIGLWRPRYDVSRWTELALGMPESRHHPLRAHATALATRQLILSGEIALFAERVRAMDAVFEEAGLELTPVAHFLHAALATQADRWDDQARGHARTAIELSLRAGDRHAAGGVCAMVALFLAIAGDADEAVQCAEQATALASDLGNPSLNAMSETALGYVLSTIDPQRARPHLEAAWSMAKTADNEGARAISGRCLARLLAAQGDLLHSLEIYAGMLESSFEAGRISRMLACESLAIDLAAAGYHAVAATLFGGLESPVDSYQGNPMLKRQAAIDAVRHVIGDENFEDLASRGRAMDTDELAAFARTALSGIVSELDARQLTE